VSTIEAYRRAQSCFDSVLAAVPPNAWDLPSACESWTIRDVAGHVVWGQEQLRHWATGQQYGRADGAPGAPHPAVLAGSDPVKTFRAARTAASGALTDEALDRPVRLPGLGEQPVREIVRLLITDHLAHTWDIASPLGLAVPLDTDLVAGSFAWARDHMVRAPGFFGPELTPPGDASEQTRWLAYLGRAQPQPITT
jgi:uncharacterized protein (TIGR03086 family)